MLYPIELLGHGAAGMVTAPTFFVSPLLHPPKSNTPNSHCKMHEPNQAVMQTAMQSGPRHTITH